MTFGKKKGHCTIDQFLAFVGFLHFNGSQDTPLEKSGRHRCRMGAHKSHAKFLSNKNVHQGFPRRLTGWLVAQ